MPTSSRTCMAHASPPSMARSRPITSSTPTMTARGNGQGGNSGSAAARRLLLHPGDAASAGRLFPPPRRADRAAYGLQSRQLAVDLDTARHEHGRDLVPTHGRGMHRRGHPSTQRPMGRSTFTSPSRCARWRNASRIPVPSGGVVAGSRSRRCALVPDPRDARDRRGSRRSRGIRRGGRAVPDDRGQSGRWHLSGRELPRMQGTVSDRLGQPYLGQPGRGAAFAESASA